MEHKLILQKHAFSSNSFLKMGVVRKTEAANFPVKQMEQ